MCVWTSQVSLWVLEQVLCVTPQWLDPGTFNSIIFTQTQVGCVIIMLQLW